jgi:hypothetical protein
MSGNAAAARVTVTPGVLVESVADTFVTFTVPLFRALRSGRRLLPDPPRRFRRRAAGGREPIDVLDS